VRGTVSIGEATLMGAGSTVIQKCVIGAFVIVGAGAVVVTDLPDGVTAVGVPARPTRSD
jgi:serine acetyltransferase